MRKYLFLVPLAFIFSCQTNTENYTGFLKSHEYPTNYQKLIIKDLPLIINEFWVVDSLLIIQDVQAISGHFFHVFDLNRGKKITSFGTMGAGPGESSMPNKAQLDREQRQMFMPAYDKKGIFRYNLDSAIKMGSLYKPSNFATKFAGAALGGLIEGNFVFSESPYEYYQDSIQSIGLPIIRLECIDNQTSKSLGKHPFLESDFTDFSAAARLLLGNTVINEKRKRIVFSYVHWNTLAILDYPTGETFFIKGPDQLKHKLDIKKKYIRDMQCDYAYTRLTSTDKFISALYWGGQRWPKGQEEVLPQNLHLFDWDGKPLLEMKFPFPIIDFDIDNTKDLLYVLDGTHEEPAFAVIDLKEIL